MRGRIRRFGWARFFSLTAVAPLTQMGLPWYIDGRWHLPLRVQRHSCKPTGHGSRFNHRQQELTSYSLSSTTVWSIARPIRSQSRSRMPPIVPVANAGAGQTVTFGTTVQLNGSGSQDADGDALTYVWRVILEPPGSTAILNSTTVAAPTFRADVVGTYVIQLVVSDGFSSSTTDLVTITATAAADTIPPAAADLTRITVGYVINGQVTVTGLLGAVEGSTRVTVTNQRTGQVVPVPATSTGSFLARLAGQTGDLITMVVTDAVGNVSPTVRGQVGTFSGDPVNAPFRAVWDGMNTALLAGDKATALTYLTPSARVKYGPVFDALLPYMPDIIRSYSPLQRVSVSENIGEYAVNRLIEDENMIFLIYFVKELDGTWRLAAM